MVDQKNTDLDKLFWGWGDLRWLFIFTHGVAG